ncbi:hypothetical protein ABW21_db0202091 [Orbilia brochopaga]|nr:hypothetical protein ABW21_db0202091 [Drechslerella brochopaga]
MVNSTMDGLTLTKKFCSVTFEGRNHIRSRPGQEVILRLRAKDRVELTFPSPTAAKIVQFMTRPQSLTVYYLESSDAIVLLIDDKNGTFGYPRLFCCNKTGPRHWESMRNDFAITKVASTLLGTRVFGKNHVLALKADDEDSEPGIKSIRKYLGHSKWQNVGYSLLEKKCRDLMQASGMDFNYFFPNIKGARGHHLLPPPPAPPAPPPPPARKPSRAAERKIVYRVLTLAHLVNLKGHTDVDEGLEGSAAGQVAKTTLPDAPGKSDVEDSLDDSQPSRQPGPGVSIGLPVGKHCSTEETHQVDHVNDAGKKTGDLADSLHSQVAQQDHSQTAQLGHCQVAQLDHSGPASKKQNEGHELSHQQECKQDDEHDQSSDTESATSRMESDTVSILQELPRSAVDVGGARPASVRSHRCNSIYSEATRLAPAPMVLRLSASSGRQTPNPLRRAAAGQGDLINRRGPAPSGGANLKDNSENVPVGNPAAGLNGLRKKKSRQRLGLWGDLNH